MPDERSEVEPIRLPPATTRPTPVETEGRYFRVYRPGDPRFPATCRRAEDAVVARNSEGVAVAWCCRAHMEASEFIKIPESFREELARGLGIEADLADIRYLSEQEP